MPLLPTPCYRSGFASQREGSGQSRLSAETSPFSLTPDGRQCKHQPRDEDISGDKSTKGDEQGGGQA